MKWILVFLHNARSFILIIAIFLCQYELFCDCANGFANCITNIFQVNVDVSYDGNHNFSELMNKSKPELMIVTRMLSRYYCFWQVYFFSCWWNKNLMLDLRLSCRQFFSCWFCKTSLMSHTSSWHQCLQWITFFYHWIDQ